MTKPSEAQLHVELDIPDAIANTEHAVELMRAWIGDGALMLALNSEAFGERVVDWGRILGEIGHHVARAAKLNGHMSEHEALQALQQGFESAVRTAQPTLSGKLQGRVNH
jgi:Domain of unknown function (DUF5076)